jgi:GNAT superfamily N-acetyltransferase
MHKNSQPPGNNVSLSAYRPGAIGKITEMHALYYHRHWNFGQFFERRVATEMSAFLETFLASRDGFWLAVRSGRILGAVALDGSRAEQEGAHLRWFIVDEDQQGDGIGGMLLREALAFSDRRGYGRVYLWTFAGLEAARHLYEENGFRLCQELRDDQWGVPMTEQMFERMSTP